ncbi:MAG TPA: hypothetical protein VGJ60_20005 [Chloroflexota bacterium]
MRARLAVLPLAVCALVLAAIVLLAYPRPADADVRQVYAELEHSTVPVQVIGWVQPANAHAQLVDGGYVFTEQTDRLGEVRIAADRDASQLPPGDLKWQAADTSYSVQSSGDVEQLAPRVVLLQVAKQQIAGASLDTPLLYVAYLPALILTGAWLTVSLLRRP